MTSDAVMWKRKVFCQIYIYTAYIYTCTYTYMYKIDMLM